MQNPTSFKNKRECVKIRRDGFPTHFGVKNQGGMRRAEDGVCSDDGVVVERCRIWDERENVGEVGYGVRRWRGGSGMD